MDPTPAPRTLKGAFMESLGISTAPWIEIFIIYNVIVIAIVVMDQGHYSRSTGRVTCSKYCTPTPVN